MNPEKILLENAIHAFNKFTSQEKIFKGIDVKLIEDHSKNMSDLYFELNLLKLMNSSENELHRSISEFKENNKFIDIYAGMKLAGINTYSLIKNEFDQIMIENSFDKTQINNPFLNYLSLKEAKEQLFKEYESAKTPIHLLTLAPKVFAYGLSFGRELSDFDKSFEEIKKSSSEINLTYILNQKKQPDFEYAHNFTCM